MDDNQWHLNKSVPITLIITILLQSSVAIWWAARTTFTQETIIENQTAQIIRFEKWQADMNAENLRQWARINNNEDTVNTLRAETNTTREILRRVESSINMLNNQIDNLSEVVRDNERSSRDRQTQ